MSQYAHAIFMVEMMVMMVMLIEMIMTMIVDDENVLLGRFANHYF